MKHKIARRTMAAGLSLVFIFGGSVLIDAKGNENKSGIAGSAVAIEEYTEADNFSSQEKTISKPITARKIVRAKQQVSEPKYTVSFYRGKVVPNVKSVLNIRKKKSTSSPIVGKFKKGNIGSFVIKGKEWTRIRSGKVTGYVKNEYLIWESSIHRYAKEHNFPRKAIVSVDTLKVREKQSTAAKVLTLVSKNDSFKILNENAEWVNVKADGDRGYLAKDFVNIGYYFTDARSTVKKIKPKALESTRITETPAQRPQSYSTQQTEDRTSGDIRQRVVNYALKFVGNKYRYGGNSLTNGIDCSGFTQQVLGHFGYSISRTSSSQANDGRTISVSNVRPGDLLFYKRGGRINHVTMYIGNGQVVHASNSAPYPRGGIKVSSIGYRTPCKAVRIIN